MKSTFSICPIEASKQTIDGSFMMGCFKEFRDGDDRWEELAPLSYAYDAVYDKRKREKRLTTSFLRYVHKDMFNIYPRPVYPQSYRPPNLYYRHGLSHRIRRPKSRSNGVMPKAKKIALIYWELYR